MRSRDRILVVDDERMNRSLVEAHLSSFYDVVEADSGPEALEVLASVPIDLVLLDVMMPGMTGHEVCRTIKGQKKGTFLPVIMCTALHGREDRNEGLRAGADDFLTKPLDRTELRLRCRAFLEIRRLHRLKDDLVGLIVHDLQNPLTGIDGYIQLLQAELADHPSLTVREDLGRVAQSAARLREIVRSLLLVRLLDDGGLRPDVRPGIRIRPLVEEAVASVGGAAGARRLTVAASVADDLVAEIDPKLVTRALENLISNALKYSPAGATIELTARREESRLEIDVADRGPGVPDDLKGALFEKYGSVEAKRGETRRGHGLGLHLVRLVAEAHGGSASVHDREAGGSIFRIALPASARGRSPAA